MSLDNQIGIFPASSLQARETEPVVVFQRSMLCALTGDNHNCKLRVQ